MSTTIAPQRPDWLVRMENGSIAEARTRAFLLDRFWILERSVDVDGADFLIQRRILGSSPRLGIIQVKYFHSERTTQYVHKEYVCDKEGRPRKDFFLICHTGSGDDAKKYLLYARDIFENFEFAPKGHSEEGKYIVPGRRILNDSTYEVKSHTKTLERIEWDLNLADLPTNREFVGLLFPYINVNENDIDSMYKLDLNNNFTDIPKAFLDLKRAAQRIIWDLEDTAKELYGIVNATNPLIALDVLEGLEHLDPNKNLKFNCNIFNDNLHQGVLRHKAQYENLKRHGVLESFLNVKETCIRTVNNDIIPKMKLPSNMAHCVEIIYELITLRLISINTSIRPKSDLPPLNEEGLILGERGRVSSYWLPGEITYGEYKAGKFVPYEEPVWEKLIPEQVWHIINPLMDKILAFFDDGGL